VTARRRRVWLIGAGVFAASATLGILHSDYAWDGTWVLQVVARLHAGDVLYRDVFAGVPPLTFAIGYAATAIAGVEMAVLKVLIAVTLAVSWLACARLLRRVTASDRFDVPLAIAMIALAQPEIASFYQPLANMFLLLTIDAASASVMESGPHARRHGWLAGVWCGLAFLAKHTIGAIAGVAALAVLIAFRSRVSDQFLGRIVALAIGATAVIAAGLMPIAMTGGWPHFVDYAFLGKTTYLSVANVSYTEEYVAFLTSLAMGEPGWAVSVAKTSAMVVPALAVFAVVLLRRQRQLRDALVIGVVAALAEAAGLYPRADVAHVIPVVPGLLVVILIGWDHVRQRSVRVGSWLRMAATLAIACNLIVRFGAAGAALADDDRAFSELPHLRGILMPRAAIALTADAANKLRDAAGGKPLFLLSPNAGFHYLTSGVSNPTPFDYPLKPAFGRAGMADTIARLESGELTQVCLKPVKGLMAPDALQHYVETQMVPGADLGVCTLYRRRL